MEPGYQSKEVVIAELGKKQKMFCYMSSGGKKAKTYMEHMAPRVENLAKKNLMQKVSFQYYKAVYGELLIGSFEGDLVICDWRYRKMRENIDQNLLKKLDAEYFEEDTSTIRNTRTQLEEYFGGQRRSFDLPIRLVGSEFQVRVWNELLKIPYGEIETYLGLSRKLGDEKTIRAVAGANGANAISIIVPCHRIVGSKGEMIGYAAGKHVKKKLLGLESPSRYPEQKELF